MTQEVTDYITAIALPWQADIAARIRQIVHAAIPDVQERLQYKKPHFLKDGKYAAVLGTAKGWVSFTIFNAESLTPPDGLFESSDTGDRRTIKITEGQAVDYALIESLLRQASGA